MQSANRPLARAELHVRLDWQKVDSLFFEFPHAPRSHKAATFIVMRAGIDHPGARHSGLCTMHHRYPTLHGAFRLGRTAVGGMVWARRIRLTVRLHKA
jgi:hypothetical protein